MIQSPLQPMVAQLFSPDCLVVFFFSAFTGSSNSDPLLTSVPSVDFDTSLFGVCRRAEILRLAAVGVLVVFVAAALVAGVSGSVVDEASDFEILLREDFVG